jgi:hypothetical protein
VTLGHHHRGDAGTTAPPADRRVARQRGVALVELALIIVPLVTIVFSAIDYGRMARFQNRLRNAAREGAAVAQYNPGWVGPSNGTGCSATSGRNIIDRASNQDPVLATFQNFDVRIWKDGSNTQFPEGVCTTSYPTGVAPGDRIKVQVEASISTMAPLTRALWGSTVLLKGVAYVNVAGG